MARRLLLSMLMVSAVLATLIVGTFAYFKDSTTGTVSIEAGTTDLNIYYQAKCTGGWGDPMDSLNSSWSHIVPGDQITDCITIENVGDGALDVYVRNKDFTGNQDLRAALEFGVEEYDPTTIVRCPYKDPKDSQYKDGRGCLLQNELAPGDYFRVYLYSKFLDSGDQSLLQGETTGWTTSVDGYTD